MRAFVERWSVRLANNNNNNIIIIIKTRVFIC
jgi:hypothetical protein